MPTAGQRILAADFTAAVTAEDLTAQTDQSNTFAAPSAGSPTVEATFTAPTSGKALVQVSGQILDNGASGVGVIDWVLREDDSAGTEILGIGSAARHLAIRGNNTGNPETGSMVSLITGLTPAQIYWVQVQTFVLGGSSTLDIFMRQIAVMPQPS